MDIEDGAVQDEEARVRRGRRGQAGGGEHFQTTRLLLRWWPSPRTAARRRALEDEPKAAATRAQGYRSPGSILVDVSFGGCVYLMESSSGLMCLTVQEDALVSFRNHVPNIGCNGGVIDHNRSACIDCESTRDDHTR